MRLALIGAFLASGGAAWCEEAGGDATAAPADSVAELVRRYPPNMIASGATADAALADVARERAAIDARHVHDRQACMSVFLMTRCLDKAREQRRAALAQVRPIEIEANALKRRERVVERDRVLEEKKIRSTPETLPAKRSANAGVPNATSPGGSPRAADAAERGAASPAVPHPRTPHVGKLATPSIDAATEAKNAAAFDRKATESEARQQEIASKKREKENERARKKADSEAAAMATPGTR